MCIRDRCEGEDEGSSEARSLPGWVSATAEDVLLTGMRGAAPDAGSALPDTNSIAPGADVGKATRTTSAVVHHIWVERSIGHGGSRKLRKAKISRLVYLRCDDNYIVNITHDNDIPQQPP